MSQLLPLNKTVQIEKVNNYFNGIVNELDILNWEKEDYWATPNEFVTRGKGDCEDFVIAKYFSLKELGIEPKNMMLIIVKVDGMKELHAVLGVKNGSSEILILDNLSWKILPLSKRTDLKIVRWVNETYLDKSDKPEVKLFTQVIKKMQQGL